MWQGPDAFSVHRGYVECFRFRIRHTVGNHTMTHPDMSGISSKDDFQKQLDGVEKLYESVTGEQMTKFYRPPQGIYSTSNLAMAKELGYSTFFWSLAYVDWIQNQQPSRIRPFVEEVLCRRTMAPG